MAAIIGGTPLGGSMSTITSGQTTLNGQLVTMLLGVYAFRVEP